MYSIQIYIKIFEYLKIEKLLKIKKLTINIYYK